MKPLTACCKAFRSLSISTCYGYCPGAIFSTDRVFSFCSIIILLKDCALLPGMGGVQQSRHEESENSTRFKKCESDKKVQHGTPQSMQMQVSLSRSIIRVTLLASRYFWMVYISHIVRDAKLPSSSKR